FSSFTNQFRGTNRMWRETNRLQYRAIDGLEGQFVPTSLLILQKAALDFTQEFIMYSAAALVVTAIVNQGQFSPLDWAKIFVAGGVIASVKVGNTVLHDLHQTGLKGYKDGLANVDGGKDWNRNPYNNDKHWGNEWAGNETPFRWRSTTYD
nr:hypothetical protein [Micromonospora sp. DSM 115978]